MSLKVGNTNVTQVQTPSPQTTKTHAAVDRYGKPAVASEFKVEITKRVTDTKVSRESVRKYLAAALIQRGKDVQVGGKWGAELDRACNDMLKSGIPEATVLAMRGTVGPLLKQKFNC